MGSAHNRNTSIIDIDFLKSLSLSTPLQRIQQQQTQIHEIASLSPEHHQIMLQKIRAKKSYDCDFIIKIIDSHTLQSKNLCSTVIKVYIVVEKPQSLAQQIQQRTHLNLGFQQNQIQSLIYSCCEGAAFLQKNNIQLYKLNTNRVFIDLKGCIKINDPEFIKQQIKYQNISQAQFIRSVAVIAKQLIRQKNLKYSKYLTQLVQLMLKQDIKLGQVLQYINMHYLNQKNSLNTQIRYSSNIRSNTYGKSKKKLSILSGRKKSDLSHITHRKNQQSDFSLSDHFLKSYEQSDDKQNAKNNCINVKQNAQLFTFKDPFKQLNNTLNHNSELDSHLFPKKALFKQNQKSRHQKKISILPEIIDSYNNMAPSVVENSMSSHKQVLTHYSSSLANQTQQSLEGSKVINMVSYQVDQQTIVRQISNEQSQYFLQLMNQCKSSKKCTKYSLQY